MNTTRSYLNSVESVLAMGDYLVSPTGKYFLIMQHDGNLVLYRGSAPENNMGAVWNAESATGDGTYHLAVQTDGNLVIYCERSDTLTAVWNSSTHQENGSYFLSIQDNGRILLCRGDEPANNEGVIWLAGGGTNSFDSTVTFKSRRALYQSLQASQKKEHDTLLEIERLSTLYKGRVLKILSDWLTNRACDTAGTSERREMERISGVDLASWISLQEKAKRTGGTVNLQG